MPRYRRFFGALAGGTIVAVLSIVAAVFLLHESESPSSVAAKAGWGLLLDEEERVAGLAPHGTVAGAARSVPSETADGTHASLATALGALNAALRDLVDAVGAASYAHPDLGALEAKIKRLDERAERQADKNREELNEEIDESIEAATSDILADADLTVSAAGLALANDTLALAAGYEIPLSASTTAWNAAYSWGDHGIAGYLTAANNLSDLANATTSRANLGLGTLATQNAADVTLADLAVTGTVAVDLPDGCVEIAGGTLTSIGVNCGTSSGGITSVNGLTASSQTFDAATSSGLALSITSAGGTHTFTTGLAAGYEIPLSASTTAWNAAYSWGDHALMGYLVAASADTEAEIEALLTDAADVYTDNDGSLSDDDLADNGVEDLSDVAAMTEAVGDLLSWNGLAWANVATSSLGLGAAYDQSLNTADTVSFAGLSVTGAATSTFSGNIGISGSIIPSADITYDLGSPVRQWKDVYIGPGSLYINGQKVLEESGSDIVVGADDDQNLLLESAGVGSITTRAVGTGNANVLSESGNINITSTSGNLNIGTTGSGQLNLGTVTAGAWHGTDIDISDYTNLTVSATGLTLSGDTLALAAGYAIPLSASTTAWITDGNAGWDNAYNLFDKDIDDTDDLTEGTTNLFSQWSASGDDISFAGGNVGIGTTTPTQKLHIGSNASVGTETPDAISLGGSYSTTAGANPKLRLFDVGTEIYGLGVSAGQLDYIVPTDSHHVWYVGDAEAMRVANSRSVGIGTESPAALLQVGDVLTNALGTTAGSDIDMLKLASFTGNEDSLNFTAERVSNHAGGTGWTSAAHRIQRIVDITPMGYLQFGNLDSNLITFGEADTEYMRIDGSGLVGIGTTAPTHQLTVNGSVGFTNLPTFNTGSYLCIYEGGVNMGTTCSASDARLKTGTSTLSSTLDLIMEMDPVSYYWKDESYGTGEQIGFIAQQIEPLFPQVVTTNSEGYKSLQYDKLAAPIVRAIQELNVRTEYIEGLAAVIKAPSAGAELFSDLDSKTFWTRLAELAASFVDGVLKLAGADIGHLESETIEAEELCVGDICVTEAEFARVFGAGADTDTGEEANGEDVSHDTDEGGEQSDSGNSAAYTLTRNGDAEVTIEVGKAYADEGATATDADGNSTPIVTFVDGVEVANVALDTGAVASYTVTYRIKDAVDEDGAPYEVSRTVNVVEPVTGGESDGDAEDGLTDGAEPLPNGQMQQEGGEQERQEEQEQQPGEEQKQEVEQPQTGGGEEKKAEESPPPEPEPSSEAPVE